MKESSLTIAEYLTMPDDDKCGQEVLNRMTAHDLGYLIKNANLTQEVQAAINIVYSRNIQDNVNEEENSSGEVSSADVRSDGSFDVRPWCRFWARSLDTIVAIFIFYFLVLGLYPKIFEFHEAIQQLLFGILCFIMEPVSFAIFGNTPGKSLMRIRVLNNDGSRLTFTDAFKRYLRVWFYGLGIGFPIIAVFTIPRSYIILKNKGTTIWDEKLGMKISHSKVGFIRTIVAIIILATYPSMKLLVLYDIWGDDKTFYELIPTKVLTVFGNCGDSSAQVQLGFRHFIGMGIKEDHKEAIKWFRLAAEQGNPDAQYSLGLMYDKGLGVEKNMSEAERLYQLAAKQGDE